FAVGTFNGDDIVLELHSPTADSGRGEVPHTFGKLLYIHGGLRRRRWSLRDVLRHVYGDGRIRLHVVDLYVENWKIGLGFHDVRWKLHALKVRIVGIGDLISEVPDDFV